ncbi:4Fe-4S binding protein [candidate division KSB1 bacterium]|nr:4Fe-4S binding protein [candidate division KSB1 bacterium]
MLLKNKTILLTIFIIMNLASAAQLFGIERFPRPQFESDYQQPRMTSPDPRAATYEYIDIAALLAALSVTTFLILKKRSRRGVFVMMLLSIAYFGFWRKGCVCSVGSIQNVAYALANPDYAIPISVIVFFILPLVFSLFFGRTFCAGVCPLGAIQDVVILKPQRIPLWLNHMLRGIPFLYLGIAVLAAVTGSMFLICRFDPFIALYRMGGDWGMVSFGVALLLVGVFIARPYCRFLCPYGVLLGWLSKFSKYHASITPDECIQCKLCETSCPFEAIDVPVTEKPVESQTVARRRLAIILIVMPVFMLLGGWIGSHLNKPLSRLHPTVRLAEQVNNENAGRIYETTIYSRTFRASGETMEQLMAEVRQIEHKYKIGGWWLGMFLATAAGMALINLSRRRRQTIYETNHTHCLSCGRCFDYCPRHHALKGDLVQT